MEKLKDDLSAFTTGATTYSHPLGQQPVAPRLKFHDKPRFSAGNNLLPLNVLGRVTHHPLCKSGCVAPGFQMVKIFLIRTGILPPLAHLGQFRTLLTDSESCILRQIMRSRHGQT